MLGVATENLYTNRSQQTIFYACRFGIIATIELALAYGGSLHCRYLGRETPLMAASASGNTAVVKYLLDIGAPIADVDANNQNALRIAAIHGHIGPGYSSKHTSILTGNRTMVRLHYSTRVYPVR